jgi:predicted dehydrogenase
MKGISDMDKLAFQVAMIGCGWAGERHAPAFVQCGAEIRWAIDVDIKKAQALLAGLKTCQNGGKISTDFREALLDPEVDAVDICLPHDLHAPVAVECAQAKKHILCEKPIADTLSAADKMIAAAHQAGVTLMIAENEHFNPLYRKIRALVARGVIGAPALVQRTRQCYLTRSFVDDRPWFLDKKAAAGGMLMSGGVHDFETTRLILGDIEQVYALRAPQRFLELEGDDTSVVLARFKSGVIGTFVLSYIMKSLPTAAGREIHSLRIDGTLGSLSVDDEQTIRLFTEQTEPFLGEGLVQHDIVVPVADTFRLEVEHFLSCVHTGQEPETGGLAQRRLLEFVLACYRSIETGLPVILDGKAGE